MKRSKNDHIRSTVSRYFKRRQFHESEMPSRKEARQQQCISDMSVRRRTRSRTSVENTLALSSISGDATACDQNYTRLKAFVQGASAPFQQELQPLLFPMFSHIFLEMLWNGHKVPAQKFHERHADTFTDSCHGDLLIVLKTLESRSDITASSQVTEFRDNCFGLSLSGTSMDYLMAFLKADSNAIILQVFNNFFKVTVSQSDCPAPGGAMELLATPDLPGGQEVEVVDQKPDIKQEPEERELTLDEELTAALEGMSALPPPLPSICFFTFMNTYQGLCAASISPDKAFLSACFEDSNIGVWHLEPSTFDPEPPQADVSRIVLGADHLHCTQDQIRDHLADTRSHSREVAMLKGHRGAVFKTHFLTADSNFLLSCSADSTVRLWDMKTQSNTSLYQGHATPVWDLAISSTDTWFASCSHDQTAKLWTFDRTYPLRSFVGHTFDVDCAEFHPNNNYLATGSGDKTVRFWSIADGRTVRLFQGHRGSVLALAFSPNGKLMASAGEDRRIRVWDLDTGRVLKELRGHSDTVYALAFDKNSSMLASGGADCCIRVWDVNRTWEAPPREGESSPDLLGAFTTKSALVTFLGFSDSNVLMATGTSS